MTVVAIAIFILAIVGLDTIIRALRPKIYDIPQNERRTYKETLSFYEWKVGYLQKKVDELEYQVTELQDSLDWVNRRLEGKLYGWETD